MQALLPLAIVTVITASADCEERRGNSSTEKGKQASAALLYVNLLSDGELNIKEHTAISRHCSAKRLTELKAQVSLFKTRYSSTNHLFEVKEQKAAANFAAVLVSADNLSNPLETHILPIALVLRNGKWIPAPLIGSFSNTGYGYDLKTEQSVKALETWMAEGKKRHETQSREKSLDSFKDKLNDIEQEAGFDKMSPEEAVTYFIQQLKSSNMLGIIASLGMASEKQHDQIMEAVRCVSEVLNPDATPPSSNNTWPYFTETSSLTKVIKEDKDTGEVLVGCLNPGANYFRFNRWGQKIFTIQTKTVNGRRIISLNTSKNTLANPKELGWSKEKNDFRKKFSTLMFQKIDATKCDTTKALLDHLLESLRKQDFTRFMGLIPSDNDYSKNDRNHSFIMESAAYYWRELAVDHDVRYDFSQVVTDNDYALAELHYSRPDTGNRYRSEEVWMFKDKGGWHVAPLRLITDFLATNDQADRNVIDKLKQQIREKNLEVAFSKTSQTSLPLPPIAISEELAKNRLHDYLERLGHGDINASLANCVMLKGTDKDKLMQYLERAARSIKDQSEDIHILGSVTKAGWVGISARTKSRSSALYDYPLYLIANTEGGPRVFLNLDLRYPRNSGRSALNEANWKTFKNAAPEKSISILDGIAKEHYKLCEKDIADMEQ